MAKAHRAMAKKAEPVKASVMVRSAGAAKGGERPVRTMDPNRRSSGGSHSENPGARKNTLRKPQQDLVAVLVTSGPPEFTLSSFEKMDLIENGISKKALENLKDKAGLDYDQLARILNVARATLISKKGSEKFNADLSDKILGLADIYSYGYEVFEDRDNFNQWVFSSNRALGQQSPFDILHTSFGREEVKNLIGRIDYGIYS